MKTFLYCIYLFPLVTLGLNKNSEVIDRIVLRPSLLESYKTYHTSDSISACSDAIIEHYQLPYAIEIGVELTKNDSSCLQIFGDIILSKSAATIEKSIKEGYLDPDDTKTKILIEILAINKYHIRVDMSDFQKVLLNLKRGNYRYLLNRLTNRIHPFLPLIIIALSIIIVFVLGFILLRINQLNKLKLTTMRKLLTIIFATLLVSSAKAQSLAESSNKSIWNGEVQINMLSFNGNNIGQSIYLSRSSKKVKAKYFASPESGVTVYDRYSNWKQGKKIILCCAGAYLSGNYSSPLGLTIDEGQLVNRNVDATMDGLVIVEAVGGIRISDLDQKNCTFLNSENKYVNPRDPFQKQQFINWSNIEKATVFQTNLLYYKNSEKLGSVQASAERRILTLIERNGSITHSIFNIESSVSLTDVAREIYNMLRTYGYSIIAMINLDTGMCNAFELYDSYGHKLPFQGSADIKSLSNMIVYYYE